MRKLIALAATTVALATALGVGATRIASAGSPDGGDLVLTEKTGPFTQLDLGEKGLSQGDTIVYESEVFDTSGAKVGRDAGECVVVTPRDDTLGLTNCVFTVELEGGQLAGAGLFDFIETHRGLTLRHFPSE